MTDPLYRQPAAYAFAPASDKTTVLVVYALYLAGFFSAGLTTLMGLVITYALWGGASDLARSHYEFLRRTFWFGLLWTVAAGVAALAGVAFAITIIGLPVALLLFIVAKVVGVVALVWYGVRCVAGLLAALGDRPHGAPRSLWI